MRVVTSAREADMTSIVLAGAIGLDRAPLVTLPLKVDSEAISIAASRGGSEGASQGGGGAPGGGGSFGRGQELVVVAVALVLATLA